MRNRLKQIGAAAVIAALTVAGLSVASGGGGGGGGDTSSDDAGARTSFAVGGDGNGNGDRTRERKLRLHGDFADADVRAVLKDIRDAVAKQAPDIAGPVIEKAENDGKITAAQADKLRQAAQDLADGKRPDIRGLKGDADVHEVIHDAFEAAHKKVPGIAEPIIDKAVEDKKITEAQADRVREMIEHGPLGFGPPGRGPHAHKFGGPGPFADEDVRAVLEDVHQAVAKQAPDIVKPVIDEAEQDGKITAAQADRLRDLAGNLAGGKPPGGPPRQLDLRDEDVREVLKHAFEAVAAKTPGIAKPIIDKAVEDKKITEAQADELKSMQRRFKGGFGFHHGPGPGPGKPPHPDFERPAAPPVPESSTS